MESRSRHPRRRGWLGLRRSDSPEHPTPEEATVQAAPQDPLEPSAPAAPAADEPAVVPDPAEFSQLFTREAPRIWRALRRLGVRDADLDDLVQEVFLVVYRRWADFRGESSLRTWIYGIAIRKAFAQRRNRHARGLVDLTHPELPTSAPQQNHELARSELRGALQAALERLREGKREVFVLYELEELPMRDVAALLDAPLHTCYARLYAARAELAVLLRRAGHDGGGS
ncbi:MAG TPA: RNA polymerase sigma factor [Polyangiales bacterium]|nr:RNA polymerase sigma factor [Polyangiales bacterium]